VRRAVAAVVLALAGLPTPAARADVEPPPPSVSISQDREAVAVSIGERFSFTTRVIAPADTAVDGLIAHLNIVSLDPDTYVDPEDWSDERTQYLPEIPAGGEQDLPWTVQAVNHGSFVVYVALARAGAGQGVLAGPGLRADVTAQRVINAEGILPLALAVPAALGVLLLVTRLHRRRST